jgi:two-component system nitrate/nitrite sensor histidine kinase NarX
MGKRVPEFLVSLTREVAPVLFNRYLVARLRSRAQAKERIRLAQELHDGVVQSLLGVELQIGQLLQTRKNPCQPSCVLLELARLQGILHKEIAELREEMQRVRPLEVIPAKLLDSMAAMVDRFGLEGGISASFSTGQQEIAPPSRRVCTELIRILQEALVNVRKHSGAHHVSVHFGHENGGWKLRIEDDGCGMGFTGQMTSGELDAWSRVPAIIKERVHSIGGELIIQSTVGSGTVLEIWVPPHDYERMSRTN